MGVLGHDVHGVPVVERELEVLLEARHRDRQPGNPDVVPAIELPARLERCAIAEPVAQVRHRVVVVEAGIRNLAVVRSLEVLGLAPAGGDKRRPAAEGRHHLHVAVELPVGGASAHGGGAGEAARHVRRRRLARDDVDHAAEGVRSVGDGGRPAHHLDALDLRRVHERGMGPVASRAVHRAAVHHHQHALARKAAHHRALLPGAVLAVVHAGHSVQRIAHHRGLLLAELGAGHERERLRRLVEGARIARARDQRLLEEHHGLRCVRRRRGLLRGAGVRPRDENGAEREQHGEDAAPATHGRTR